MSLLSFAEVVRGGPIKPRKGGRKKKKKESQSRTRSQRTILGGRNAEDCCICSGHGLERGGGWGGGEEIVWETKKKIFSQTKGKTKKGEGN